MEPVLTQDKLNLRNFVKLQMKLVLFFTEIFATTQVLLLQKSIHRHFLIVMLFQLVLIRL